MANQFPTESTTTGTTGSTGTSATGYGSSGYGGAGPGSGLGSGPSSTGAAVPVGNGERKLDRAVKATHEVVDRAAGTVEQAAGKLRSSYDHMLEIEHEWADTARSRVREHPLTSIAMALAVGLVVGRLTSHR